MGLLVKGNFSTLQGFEFNEIYVKLACMSFVVESLTINVNCEFIMFLSRTAFKSDKFPLPSSNGMPQNTFCFSVASNDFKTLDLLSFAYLQFQKHLKNMNAAWEVQNVFEEGQNAYESDVQIVKNAFVAQPSILTLPSL